MSENPQELKAEEQKAQRKNQLATAILAGSIAVLGTIAGTVIANISQSETVGKQLANERSERLADLRREAYIDYITRSMDMEFELLLYGRNGLTKSELLDKMLPKYRDVAQGLSKVLVIGTEPAIAAARKMIDAIPEVPSSSKGKEIQVTRAEVEKAIDKIDDEIGNFVDAIRPELHLTDPLPSLESPPTS
jgi:hypothetical protein